MDLNKHALRKVGLLAAGCILLYWALQNSGEWAGVFRWVWGMLTPFIIGGALAFILNVPMRALERRLPRKLSAKARRPIALLLALLGVLGAVALVAGLVVPQLVDTVQQVGGRLPVFWASVQDWINDMMVKYPEVGEMIDEALGGLASADWPMIVKTVTGWLQSGGLALVGNTINAAGSVMSGFFNSFIGVCFAFYLLSQKEKLATQLKMLLYAYAPQPRAQRIVEMARLTEKTFSSFLSGQCLEACILGCMFAVAMFVCRMPYVTMISVLIAFTALIPMFGAFIGCGVGAFLIMVQNPLQAVWFVVLFLCLQQVEGNLIYPRVVGNSVGLPSIWVLVAVTVGGSLMGILGMLVMIPLGSVCYSVLRQNTHRRLRNRGISYKELWPAPATEKGPDRPKEPAPGKRPGPGGKPGRIK